MLSFNTFSNFTLPFQGFLYWGIVGTVGRRVPLLAKNLLIFPIVESSPPNFYYPHQRLISPTTT